MKETAEERKAEEKKVEANFTFAPRGRGFPARRGNGSFHRPRGRGNYRGYGFGRGNGNGNGNNDQKLVCDHCQCTGHAADRCWANKSSSSYRPEFVRVLPTRGNSN